MALTVPLGHSGGTGLHKPPWPIPLGAVLNSNTQSTPCIAEGMGRLCLLLRSTQEPAMGRENQMAPATPHSGP